MAFKVLVVAVLIFVAGLLVHATGGIKQVFSRTMYIPTLLAAYYFRIPGGLIAGIVGGLVLGAFHAYFGVHRGNAAGHQLALSSDLLIVIFPG